MAALARKLLQNTVEVVSKEEESKSLSNGLLALIVILVVLILALLVFSIYKLCTGQHSTGWLRFDRKKRKMVTVNQSPGCELADEPDNDEVNPYGRPSYVIDEK